MHTVHVLVLACPAHWRRTASPTVSLRFLLSLNSRGTTTTRRRAASAERGGRTDSREANKKKKKKKVWKYRLPRHGCVFYESGMNLLSVVPVCTITGFEEAARRGGWEHRAKAAATAPKSQCARSERRQGDNTDPRAHWGAAISYLGRFLPETFSRVAFLRPTSDLLTWLRQHWLRDEGKWFDLQTQPWRLRRNSERTRR